jgi:hypothetical protein
MYGFVLISVVAARTLDGFYGENAAARGYIDEGDIGFYLGMVTEVLNIEIGIEFDHHGHDDDKCAYQAVELSFGKKGFAELEFFRHDEIALFGAFDRLYETFTSEEEKRWVTPRMVNLPKSENTFWISPSIEPRAW